MFFLDFASKSLIYSGFFVSDTGRHEILGENPFPELSTKLSTARATVFKPLYKPNTFTVVWIYTVVSTVVVRTVVRVVVVYWVAITTLVYTQWITIKEVEAQWTTPLMVPL
jgi:hypothetical protein